MVDHLDSVKEYVRQHERMRDEALEKGDNAKAAMWAKRISVFNAVIDELEELRRVTKPIPASYGDLSDLPQELIRELSGIKVDDLEQQLFTIIRSGGNEIDLDTILIELFRRYEVIQTRKFLQNKLWRMCQKEIIFSVPGRKGIYTSEKPESDEFSELLNSPAATELGSNIPPKGGWGNEVEDEDTPF